MTAAAQPRRVWRIIDLIQWGQPHFEERGITNARLEVEWLLGHLLNMDRVDLYVQFERPMEPGELAQFKQLVKRRTAGEPLQYVIGTAPFYGRDFKVTPAVLIPRPESEVIIEQLIGGLPPRTVLDIGTGSGCLAITAALEIAGCQVTAVDISSEALAIAKDNARTCGAENIRFEQLDILVSRPEGAFDAVLCNPPYVADDELHTLAVEVRDHEPPLALFDGGDGLKFYRRLAEMLPDMLSPAGRLITEFGGRHQLEQIKEIFGGAGREVTIHPDLQGDPRVAVVTVASA
ncbi:MAG: peptide chain release factor N(5)-glutamine methyltransferase [Candidatus Marinimicrobia bacterium]|nr:peptide chain release factor N(5)-glutamine methyltransferase [Candidatus Neomarinimicrobiota bacterium]